MVGQQGQAGGKPQEAGGVCGAVAGKAVGGAVDAICEWGLNNIYSNIIMNLKLIY